MQTWSVGTDTGGTFTDLVALSNTGEILVTKTPSTPPAFERGVVSALREVGLEPEALTRLYHGTTVSTNALLTRTGTPTALLTTMGYRDILEIRDGRRGDVYDLTWNPPEPLIARSERLEITERVAYDGSVITPLDEEEVRRAANIIRKRGITAVAIVYLHAYANPAHEARTKEILGEELDEGVYITTSSEVMPEPPEFLRTTTTVANAYVGPVLSEYVVNLKSHAAEHGYTSSLAIMHSGGGTMTPENAVDVAVRTATSGPAAGVIAAAALAEAIGRSNVVSLDMGGTSADIATIKDGQPRITTEQSLEWGMPLGFPSIDLVAIGAGGGSIAWIDAAGVPHSGPQSAGANPGPACYGAGGTAPTNTDANLVLGRLRPETFLGGRKTVNVELAREAVRTDFADPLGLDHLEAAAGILRISNQNMVNAIRGVTVHRGLDPREFSLIGFGGAGPMHTVALAKELEIPEVIIPLNPGATSALGLLFADARHDFVRSVIEPMDKLNADELEAHFAEMEDKARSLLLAEGYDEDAIQLERQIELRYISQVRSLPLTLGHGPITPTDLEALTSKFHDAYEREYKYAIREFPVESKGLRVVAIGTTTKPEFRRDPRTGAAEEALLATQKVYFEEADGLTPTAFYDRARLLPGAIFTGPAIVEQFDSTTVVPPGSEVEVDELLNLIIRP